MKKSSQNAPNAAASGQVNGASTANGADLRSSDRHAFDVQVGVNTGHRLFVGLTSNISGGGLFIATREELKRGEHIEVRFSIPGSNHVFEKRAEVCWTRPIADSEESGTQPGAGVKLIGLSDDEQQILNRFLEAHDPLFFDS
jgi:uncharacterized protein (TIGR02266 family)